jgi:membrane protease YdiL (CAAX protease family)
MNNLFALLAENARQRPGFAVLFGWLVYLGCNLLLIAPLLQLAAMALGLQGGELTALLGGNMDVHPAGKQLFRLFQTLNQLLSWGLAAWLMGALLGRPREALGLHAPVSGLALGLASLTMLVSIPLVYFLQLDPDSLDLPAFMEGFEAQMHALEASSRKALFAMFSDPGPGALVLNLLVFAAVPALCEELFFRGFLQQQLARLWHPQLAIWLTALIFSLVHFQFYGFVPRLLLGALLGYFLWRSGRLWPSLAAHFCFNATAVVSAYVAAARGELDMDTAQAMPWPWALVSALLTGFLLMTYLRRISPVSTPPHE